MRDYNWEYVNDNIDTLDNYNESMTEGTYLDDEYYDQENNEWENYYHEIQDEIEY